MTPRAAAAPRRARARRRGHGLGLLAIVAALAAAAPERASAHSSVIRTSPADGAALASAPTRIAVTFNETVAAKLVSATLRVAGGPRVPLAGVRAADGGRELVATPRDRLSPGIYDLGWRALSARDGHVIEGKLAFRVLEAAGARVRGPERSAFAVPTLRSAARTEYAVRAPGAALRWLGLLAISGLIGGVALARLVLAPVAATRPELRDASRRALGFAAACGAAALLVGCGGLAWQAHELTGGGGGLAALTDAATGLLSNTRWGELWILGQAAVLGLALVALAMRRAAHRALPVLATALALGLVTTRALATHAASADGSEGMSVGAATLHTLAAAVWLGGLAAALVALAPLARRHGRALLEVSRPAWSRFGVVAALSVGTLAVTGIYGASGQVASLDALLTSLYGRVLLGKTALVAVVLCVAALSAVLVRRPHVRLRRLLAAETALATAVVLAAALLGSAPPARGPQFEPRDAPSSSLSATSGDLLVTVSAKPNRPGANLFAVTALSTRRPAPAPVSSVDVRLASLADQAARATLPARAAGEGRWLAPGNLVEAGPLRLDVVARRTGMPAAVVGFRWTVAPVGGAREPVLSDAPLAPVLEPLAALLAAILLLAGLARSPWGRRLRAGRAHAALAALALALGLYAAAAQTASASKIAAPVQRTLATAAPDERISVIVTLRGGARAAAAPRGAGALRARAAAARRGLRPLLRAWRATGKVGRVRPLWIINGLALSATRSAIRELAARPDVLVVAENTEIAAPDAPVAGALGVRAEALPEPSVALVGAPALWALGARGQGVVVASLDSGVDASHPDLAGRWRGGPGGWFDPSGEHPDAPHDDDGHGTRTMGVAVGGAAGASAIGIAPDARWIAAKVFDDRGRTTVERVHRAFQWVLDPDRDPRTPDTPQVVFSSWSYDAPGCRLEFVPDLRALRAAGILPIFAAGNTGPRPNTSVSPANNPGAFAVGATDLAGAPSRDSARGPSACSARRGSFPHLVAPGSRIRTSDRFGGYVRASGTSMAAPAVAGALALLLSAHPGISPAQQEEALLRGAADLGAPGPDDVFGAGRLDALASHGWLAGRRVLGALSGEGDPLVPAERRCRRSTAVPTRGRRAAARAAVLCLINRERALLRLPALLQRRARGRVGARLVARARGRRATPAAVVRRWLADPRARAVLLDPGRRHLRVKISFRRRAITVTALLGVRG